MRAAQRARGGHLRRGRVGVPKIQRCPSAARSVALRACCAWRGVICKFELLAGGIPSPRRRSEFQEFPHSRSDLIQACPPRTEAADMSKAFPSSFDSGSAGGRRGGEPLSGRLPLRRRGGQRQPVRWRALERRSPLRPVFAGSANHARRQSMHSHGDRPPQPGRPSPQIKPPNAQQALRATERARGGLLWISAPSAYHNEVGRHGGAERLPLRRAGVLS